MQRSEEYKPKKKNKTKSGASFYITFSDLMKFRPELVSWQQSRRSEEKKRMKNSQKSLGDDEKRLSKTYLIITIIWNLITTTKNDIPLKYLGLFLSLSHSLSQNYRAPGCIGFRIYKLCMHGLYIMYVHISATGLTVIYTRRRTQCTQYQENTMLGGHIRKQTHRQCLKRLAKSSKTAIYFSFHILLVAC